MYFAMVEGRAECVRIEIGGEFLPGEDPSALGAKFAPGRLTPLTTSVLRDINLHTDIKTARREWVKTLDRYAAGQGVGITAENRKEAKRRLPLAREAAALDRPGPQPLTKKHFEDVALTYRDAHERDDPPTLAVATKFAVSPSTAGRWVGIARNEYHLLPKTERGRARSSARRPRRPRGSA